MSAEVVVMSADGRVKVAIQVRTDAGELLPPESLWATVVYEDRRRGIYCLLNTPFWAPFALGDLVEARFRDNGERFVTSLHKRGGRTAHLLTFPVSAATSAIERLVEQWTATGTWVEAFAGGTALAVAVDLHAGGRPDGPELELLTAQGSLACSRLLADPEAKPDHPCFRSVIAA
jgi:Domain of unknown function (DUF4265)